MTDLVIVMDLEAARAAHAKKVLEGEGWENVFVVGSKESLTEIDTSYHHVEINPGDRLGTIRDSIKHQLSGRVQGIEVAVNFICGSGKEHMAVISALLQLGIGFRLVALTPEGITEV